VRIGPGGEEMAKRMQDFKIFNTAKPEKVAVTEL